MRSVPRTVSGVLAGGLLIAGLPASAQEPKTRAEPQPAPQGEPRRPSRSRRRKAHSPGPRVPGAIAGPTNVPLQGELPLSLQEAIALGIENNLDVQIARFDPLIATEDATTAWGYYDPSSSASTSTAIARRRSRARSRRRPILLEKEHFGRAASAAGVPKLGWNYEIAYDGGALETNSSIAVALAAVRGGPRRARSPRRSSRASSGTSRGSR